ncbi:MAG: hypothetical protein FWE11_04050 [Defluviitaleaceae bacterium]|nr:hypothetical protein [Defluviitaleaceae bacterium]
MDKQTWLSIKQQQIRLYRKRAAFHRSKRGMMVLIYVLTGISAAIMPWVMFSAGQPLIALGFFIMIPVTMLVWKLSTHENRSSQLLLQLADAVDWELKKDRSLESMKKAATLVETRFLSNDDELFVKKAIWGDFMNWKRRKRDEEIRYERAVAEYNSRVFNAGPKPMKNWVPVGSVHVGPVWNTDIPHRQGYKDSNTIGDEWAIIKALRRLIWASYTETHGILSATSILAQKNPVVFERYLRKKKISKKMKRFKWRAGVHYLSAAAKMRLVTFVEETLSLEPTHLNEATVTLLHEKNEQIKKYTDEFWKVHRRSLKFYWFEALWLLLLIPFLAGAGSLIGSGAITEAVILFTTGAALVAFGEMALVVRQKIKLNGKKLIPPLIASLIGSRHAMCADTDCEEGIENYRRRFKNLEKHFIMTTPEIDSVKYVKDNLRDEERTSKLHKAEEICDKAQGRMDRYYTMFHLYRRKCLQYGALELFLAIMLVPAWGVGLIGMAHLGYIGIDLFIPTMVTLSVLIFEIIAIRRHIRVWRFKEMYFKIYQGLSVLIVDGDLRLDPEKLDAMFKEIECSALEAICNDPAMRLMAGTLSRVSGLEIPAHVKTHTLDRTIDQIRADRIAENNRNGNITWR